jgi:opacity protein-like surface antigen
LKFTLSIIFVFTGLLAFSQKTDTIIHINGNVLTGEIKRLDYGIVTYKMDGMGTISFETDKIRTIRSGKQYEIRLVNGINYFGTLDTIGTGRKVKIVISNNSNIVSIDSITDLYPIKQNFWLRLSGKFSLGLNYTKANKTGNFDFNGQINYRKRRSEFSFNWNNTINTQKDTISSSKEDIMIGFKRDIRNKWAMNFLSGINRNSEMKLDLRLYLTASANYDLIINHRNRLYSGVGLSTNREWSNGDSLSVNNQELFLTANYKLFKYLSPKFDVSTDLTFFPSLSTKGRLRVEYNLSTRLELFNDFFLGINYYYSFDNKPLNSDASHQDWGISTTISYSFH